MGQIRSDRLEQQTAVRGVGARYRQTEGQNGLCLGEGGVQRVSGRHWGEGAVHRRQGTEQGDDRREDKVEGVMPTGSSENYTLITVHSKAINMMFVVRRWSRFLCFFNLTLL